MIIDQITLYIAAAVAAAIVAALILIHRRIASISELAAAPRRAKPEEDQTVIDRLIIEADKRIDALNIQQFEGFLTDFVAANIDQIIRTAPVIGPMAAAAEWLDPVFEAYQRRNPDLAKVQKPSRQTMQEKLAGAIGKTLQPVIAKPADDGWRAPKVPS